MKSIILVLFIGISVNNCVEYQYYKGKDRTVEEIEKLKVIKYNNIKYDKKKWHKINKNKLGNVEYFIEIARTKKYKKIAIDYKSILEKKGRFQVGSAIFVTGFLKNTS